MTRIALVHDWLTGMRGGERALEVICELAPDADLFTMVYVPGTASPPIVAHRIHTTPLSFLPGIRHLYRHCLPLFPAAVEMFDLDDADLVISTSHCAAKAAVARPGARHLCYCFTPLRYAWDQFDQYFGRERAGSLGSAALRVLLRRLARWDARTSARVSRYVAISHYVAGRIARYYNREAAVVYPPVDTAFFTPGSGQSEGYALIVSALVPYKRIDVAIDAARLAGVPLKIIGQGPERPRLEARAQGTEVEFLGFQSDDAVRDAYRNAALVMLPGEEDFGIVPVEAQACGRPVVALAAGGARETVLDRITGVLVDDASAESLAEGLAAVKRLPFDPAVARAHAESFSRQKFAAAIGRIIEETATAPEGTRW
jgi:glycosyltransferase involved in cell wall biosynthesis